MKKIAVLFSGGLDSTYLIWKNLKEGNRVLPIYIEIKNNSNKVLLEKNRIELLFNKFKEEFDKNHSYDEKLLDNIYYITEVNIFGSGDELCFKQIPIWILGMLYIQQKGIDEIQVGYIGNDDAVSYINDIKKIYNSYKSITINNYLIPLKFPLLKKHKFDIAKQLPKQYFNLIVSCENPRIIGSENDEIIEYEPCCNCGACSHIISNNYYNLNEYPEYYHKSLIDFYAHKLNKFKYHIIDSDGNDFFEKKSEILKKRPEPHQLTINFN